MNGRFATWRFAPALLVGAFIVSIPAAASAQLRWGRPTVPRDGACFYRDAGFRGEYFCVRAGEDLPYIPGGLNDEISSIRTFGRAPVLVFRDKRFSGRSEVFAQDIYNLRNAGWNDRLSSLRVDSWRGGRGYGDGRGYGSGYGDGRGYGNGSGYGTVAVTDRGMATTIDARWCGPKRPSGARISKCSDASPMPRAAATSIM